MTLLRVSYRFSINLPWNTAHCKIQKTTYILPLHRMYERQKPFSFGVGGRISLSPNSLRGSASEPQTSVMDPLFSVRHEPNQPLHSKNLSLAYALAPASRNIVPQVVRLCPLEPEPISCKIEVCASSSTHIGYDHTAHLQGSGQTWLWYNLNLIFPNHPHLCTGSRLMNALNRNSSHSPTKFLRSANLTTYTIWSLFSLHVESAPVVTLARPSVSSSL